MIKAVFERSMKNAPAGDVFQYDAGQKMAFYGVPKNLNGLVRMQFAYQGDASTEGRIATWDEKEKAWIADVPNVYLEKSRAVNVYLYESEGEEVETAEEGETARWTAKTIYTAVFTPKARPAPGGKVTEDVVNEWESLVAEIEIKIAETGEAISRANASAVEVTERLGELDVKEAEWDERMAAAEANARAAEAAAEAAAASAADAEESAQSASETAQSAKETADSANSTAQSANESASEATSKATTANSKATAALTAAEEAKAKATGAHYWQMGPISLSVGTTGWTQDAANDRYYQDFTASGVTAEMLPYATCEKIGGAFPLCGVATLEGAIRLYMTDVPEVTDTVTVYMLGVRA